ncbi:MAG: hypothetical protein DBY08_01715 [Clostridiales bacterium]|nr:MAG: hypothetical protein DBY08_01715 [Clostridiales bacterium]
MALLLNRKYGSRLECLYYILTSCYNKFGTSNVFSLKDLKYDDDDSKNVHQYCQQLQNILGRQCCPYLNNPLSLSKCYATQSVDSDSTKSKAVSDIGGSLEALGFITRLGKRTYKVSSEGEKWVNSSFNSSEWEEIARKGVLSYGVIIGFLNRIAELPDDFTYQGLYLSYPHTAETVLYTDPNGISSYIDISTGSQKDSNTRTMSRLIGWCVAVGLIEPKGVAGAASPLAHIKYHDFLNKEELTVRNFKKTALCKSLFNHKLKVANPLSYSRLHKNAESMRENGGEDLRNATLQNKSKILDRRYVFVYVLNHYSKNNRALDFEKLVQAMENHSEAFFTAGNDAHAIMESECEIGDIAGIPFTIENDTMFVAKTTIEESVLNEDAPSESIKLAKKIIEEMEAM